MYQRSPTRRRTQHARRGGFTVIELLLVVAIISVLSALGVAVLAGAEERALENRTRNQINRILQMLNAKLEENNFRILPLRLPSATSPDQVRAFREGLLNEYLRVEFPWKQEHLVPGNFPENGNMATFGVTSADFPQIAARYAAFLGVNWVTKDADLDDDGSITAEEQILYPRLLSAECLYAILSLHTDEFGEPLIANIPRGEIGDVDGDGVYEVHDAFGDPLGFALVAQPGPEVVVNLLAAGPPADATESLKPDYSRRYGYEVNLEQAPANLLTGQDIGQVRGPRPVTEYRFIVQSVNLPFSEADQAGF